jgi:hypothetical protein
MNTGHRMEVSGVKIDPESAANPGQPSEIVLVSQLNGRDFYLPRFVLGKEGLQLVGLKNSSGEDIENQSGFGDSLPASEPAHGSNASHADTGTFTIQFSKDVEAKSVTVISYLSRPTTGLDFGPRELNLHTPVGGTTRTLSRHGATLLKAVVFGPDFETVLIDERDLQREAAPSTTVELKPQTAVPLTGTIVFPEGAKPAQYTLEVDYSGAWILPCVGGPGQSRPGGVQGSRGGSGGGWFIHRDARLVA